MRDLDNLWDKSRKADARAIRIVELQEELAEAKRIIGEFVWPPDSTKEQRQAFEIKAAQFAGVGVPNFGNDGDSETYALGRILKKMTEHQEAAQTE